MGSYMEQSQNMFTQMQEQMQKQTEQMLGVFGIKRRTKTAFPERANGPLFCVCCWLLPALVLIDDVCDCRRSNNDSVASESRVGKEEER